MIHHYECSIEEVEINCVVTILLFLIFFLSVFEFDKQKFILEGKLPCYRSRDVHHSTYNKSQQYKSKKKSIL